MSTFKRAAVSFAALGSLLAGAGAAVADGGTPAPDTRSGDGAQALCKRVPTIEKRIERALRRIDDDAAGRGSLARLQQRVTAAEKAGHTEVHTFLSHRLTARTTLRTTLEQRRKDLDAVSTWCGAQGEGSRD
ncbi:hypothetical protein ACRAR1_29220 [Streptomyces sanyensis]|uniref:hypothetical protein n=1 Tax=Streptomyces sanyensis TaxID=568869 RepID=UPI003D76F31B